MKQRTPTTRSGRGTPISPVLGGPLPARGVRNLEGEIEIVKGKEGHMNAAKRMVMTVIREQPEDSSYDEIVRELAFRGMVERGLKEAKAGKLISHGEMGRRIRKWR